MKEDFPYTGELLRKLQKAVSEAPHDEALVSAFLLLAWVLSPMDKPALDLYLADLPNGIKRAIAGTLTEGVGLH